MKKEGIQTRKRKQKSSTSVSVSTLASFGGEADMNYSKSSKAFKSSSSGRKTKPSGGSAQTSSSASSASASLNPATLPTPALLFEAPNYSTIIQTNGANMESSGALNMNSGLNSNGQRMNDG